MMMRKSILVLGALTVFAGSAANASEEIQYLPLLEELKQNTCIIKNGSAMKKMKATAKLKGINKKISSAEKDLKASNNSAYLKFKKAHAEAQLGENC